MTLFNTATNKPPPRRKEYSPGFIKVYKAFNKLVHKNEAYQEFNKQSLESCADHLADKAFAYHLYCKQKNRFQADLRRWLYNGSWDDELFEEQLTYRTAQEASKAFANKEWTHCDHIDCTKLKVKWNSSCLILGDVKVIANDRVSRVVFMLKFESHD